MKLRLASLAACAAVMLSSVYSPAHADEYGRHPLYLHAISDLQMAAWQIDHRRPEDGLVSEDETIAHDEIGAAIGDLRHAAWQDGKAVGWTPPADMALPREGRLHAAADLLRKVRADVAREEDDPRSRPFQQHGLSHVQAALAATQHAIGDARHHNDRRE